MTRTKYTLLALVVAVIITAVLVVPRVLPGVHHGSVNTYSLEGLLSGVPTLTVCIVGYAANPYISNLTAGLGEVGVPYIIITGISNQTISRCSILVISSDWLENLGNEYGGVIINAMRRGLPVMAIGPDAGNSLLMVVGNFITSKAALIVGIPTGNGKQLRPELPTNVVALEIAMIPIRNATRYPTIWEVYVNTPPTNITYAVLRAWKDYNTARAFQQYGSSLSVNIQGFNYVGHVGWYATNTYDWYGNLAGQQALSVDFYYTFYYITAKNNYYFFLNLVKHDVTGFPTHLSGAFTPCVAIEAVNGYTSKWPGQVLFYSAPIGGSSNQVTISYEEIGLFGKEGVVVGETITQGSVNWNYLSNPIEGQDKWTWTFNNPSTDTTYTLVPADIFQLNPNLPGGQPPLIETINSTALFGNYLGCFNAPSTISVTVDVYPTSVTVISTST
ncbi:MAG: hypothetical protein AT714_07200 [Vulcanisaeta sp. OSP_8]|jgi:hypothetical protein|nr:MAG: hypothetical protein AT714_07200 [Vulcanisaeta sp. OSP_8]